MNSSDPIDVPPELANVPEPDRTLVAIYSKPMHPERIVNMPELAHIPERHRVFAFALCAIREFHPKQKAEWHDQIPSAVFVAALFVMSMAGLVAGFALDGERGGAIGLALGMVAVLLLSAIMLHRQSKQRMHDFFHSEDCRAFLEKLS